MKTNPLAASSSPQQPSRAGSERRLHGVALVGVLVSLLLTLLLSALGQTVVGTALPKIVGSLQGFNSYTWAATAYLVASVILIPIAGQLSDQFGRKWFLIGGTAIFLLGSALTGVAQNMTQFIVFRTLQGLGAGTAMLVFVVVADIFPPAELARWQGLFGSVYGVASLIGPVLGGWLTDHGPLLGTLVTRTTRWRWIFYVNLPVGLIVLAALLICLPADISARQSHDGGKATPGRVDVLGAVLCTAVTVCLLLGLSWGSSTISAWSSPLVIGILAAAVLLMGVLLVVERKASMPILPLDLFGNQIFTVATLLTLLQVMVLGGLIVYLPLFFQGVQAVSATSTGVVLASLTLSSVVGAILAGLVMGALKRHRLIMILSALIMTVGTFLLTRITPTTGLLEAVIVMAIVGIGAGPFYTVPMVAAQNALPRARLGIGTTVLRYLGQLGLVLGVAIVGTVVNSTLASNLVARLAQIPGIRSLPASVVKQAANPQMLLNDVSRQNLMHSVLQRTPPALQTNILHLFNQIFDALRQALAGALIEGFVAVLIVCVVTVLCALLLKELPSRQVPDRAVEAFEAREVMQRGQGPTESGGSRPLKPLNQ
jgi:EmrB/QacA subfamily drug resistance transporter